MLHLVMLMHTTALDAKFVPKFSDAGQGLVFWSWLKFLEFFDVTNGPIFTILGWCVYDTYVLDRIKCCSCVKGFG